MEKIYTNLKKLGTKNGVAEFSAEIPAASMKGYEEEVLEDAARDFSLPGFRKGKVPESMMREHISQLEILERAANRALHEVIHEIADAEALRAIGKPQAQITKLAPGNPVEFKLRFALLPEIRLPDYKKIGKTISERKDSIEVSDKEIDESIERLRGMMAAGEALPEVNDEFVKKLGPFTSVEGFKTELRKQLGRDKEFQAKGAKRDEIVKEIVQQSKLTIPDLFLEQELEDFIANRNEQLSQAGISLDDYLKQIKKTPEELGKEERALMETQLKTSLIFGEIRDREKIVPEEKDIQTTIAELKLQYPTIAEAALRERAEAIVLQDKLFETLGYPASS